MYHDSHGNQVLISASAGLGAVSQFAASNTRVNVPECAMCQLRLT